MPGAQVRARTGLKVATKNLYADQILEGQAESGIDTYFYDVWAQQGRAPHRATLEAAARARAFIAAVKLPGPTRPSHSGGGALPELLAFYDSARPLLLRGVYETVKADWAARAFAGLVSSVGRPPRATRPVTRAAAFDLRPEAVSGIFERALRWPPQRRHLAKPARGAAPHGAAPAAFDLRPKAVSGVFERDLRWPPQRRHLDTSARGAAPHGAAPAAFDLRPKAVSGVFERDLRWPPQRRHLDTSARGAAPHGAAPAAFDLRPKAVSGVFERDLRWPPQRRHLDTSARGAAPHGAAPAPTGTQVSPGLAVGELRPREAPWMTWLRTRWIKIIRNPKVSPGPAVGELQPREAPWRIWLRARHIRNL
jgi:hypothetical protein